MGHDTFAYLKKRDARRGGNSVAYVRHAAWNEDARNLYFALLATEHDAGVSGDGSLKWFEPRMLRRALHFVVTEDQREFLEQCLRFRRGVWIAFL
jgi:hypothetical protein